MALDHENSTAIAKDNRKKGAFSYFLTDFMIGAASECLTYLWTAPIHYQISVRDSEERHKSPIDAKTTNRSISSTLKRQA